jgi:hypothetical protein
MRLKAFGVDKFPCPLDVGPFTKPKLRPRAAKTAKNAASLLAALAIRERVSEDEKCAREAICASCAYRGEDAAGSWCGVPGGCGCSVKSVSLLGLTIEGTSIAAYSEASGRLCLHPDREKGAGWPK